MIPDLHSFRVLEIFVTCFPMLIAEEIQDITKRTAFLLIDFRISTPRTGYSGKFLVLDIEKFRKPTAGCSKLIGFKFIIFAFWAVPVGMSHIFLHWLRVKN